MAKPTHEQKMRKRAKKQRQAIAGEKLRREVREAARNANMSVQDYQLMRLMAAVLR